MNLSFHAKAAAFILLFGTLLIILGCADGKVFMRPGQTMNMTSITPAGGIAVSADGLMSIIFPPGAVLTPTDVVIEQISGNDLDTTYAALAPSMAYRVTPDNLIFTMPVLVTLNLGTPASLNTGDVALDVPIAIFDNVTTRELLTTTVIRWNEAAGDLTLNGEISASGDIVIVDPPSSGIQIGVTHPDLIPASSGTGTIGATVDVVAGNIITSNSPVTWTGSGDSILTVPFGLFFPSPVGSPGAALGTTPMQVVDSFDLGCGGSGTGVLNLNFVLLGIDIDADPTFFTDLIADRNITVRFDIDIDCEAGATAFGTPTLVPVPGMMNLGSASLVPAGFSFYDAASPQLIVAGQSTGGVALATRLTLLTGQANGTLLGTGVDGSDALLFRDVVSGNEACAVTGSAQVVGILQTGQFAFDAPTVVASSTPRSDSTWIGNNSAVGLVLTDTNAIDLTAFDLAGGGFLVDATFPLTFTPISVVSNAIATTFVAINGTTRELVYIDVTSGVVETVVQTLGINPQRVRWDPELGVGAVTDFDDNTVTIFEWDGASAPVVRATANVGLGPIGLDVDGALIVCGGEQDDTWTLITYDTVNHTIVSTVTTALPFTATGTGGLRPRHATFLNDAENSVAITLFGENAIGVIPNAHP
ncbi:MAG: hypothetical protein ACI97A_002371 [Planctomycetota bacterium]|jgi:hypothetical protein